MCHTNTVALYCKHYKCTGQYMNTTDFSEHITRTENCDNKNNDVIKCV